MRYRSRATAFFALGFAACTSATGELPASSTSPQGRGQTEALYVINYRPGPTWLHGRPLKEQELEPHGAYLRELALRGDVLVAGPLTTTEGGLVVLRADTIEAARAIMQADPAVEAGKFLGEVSVWRPVIDPRGRFTFSGQP